MATNTKLFVAEIRDTQDHESRNAGDDADVTITSDTLHSGTGANDFQEYSNLRVYLHNTHDQGFDVDVQHTHPGDNAFDAPVNAATVTLAAGPSGGTTAIQGPVGAVQIVARLGALASAPTAGDLRVSIHATR